MLDTGDRLAIHELLALYGHLVDERRWDELHRVLVDGTVRVLSKGIGVGSGGRVGSVTYRDVAVRVDGGWRLASRTVELRRPEGT